MTFVDFLRQHRARPIDPTSDDTATLSPDLMLAAILLDRAGFTAAAVEPGRVIVLRIEHFLKKSVAELLGLTLPDRRILWAHHDLYDGKADETAVVLANSMRVGNMDAAMEVVRFGCAFVALFDVDDQRVVPPLMSRVLNQRFEAPLVDAEAVEAFIAQMTGQVV